MFLKMSTCAGLLIALLFFLQNLAVAATPVQVTSDPARQGRPDVRGGTVVWKDLRAGNWDIYRYSVASDTEHLVSDNPFYQNLPVTNGMVVLWQDNRNGNWDIYMKDTLIGVEQPLVEGPGNQGISDISGNTVVYVDDISGTNDIYTIDLFTRETTAVATGPSSQWLPRISGDRVVWQDDRNGQTDIYLFDLASGSELPVATWPGDHSLSDIGGSRVVWQEYNGVQYDIYLKDLDSGAVQAITNDAAYQTSPRISGDLIVWQDIRNDPDPDDDLYDYDIYMYDLTADLETQLMGGPSISAYPAVDGERVVWEDTAAGDYDVWMATVPDTTPPLIGNESPADGSVQCAAGTISASLSDNRTGIDADSLVMLVDGADVTAEAVVAGDAVSYDPGALAQGPHTVSLSISDAAGNQSTRDWGFDISSPMISLASLHPFWNSYGDYDDGILTVEYAFANAAGASPALGVMIQASPSSSGVIALEPIPSPGVDIPAAGEGMIVLRYLIPPGVLYFTTTVYISLEDECGGHYLLPGPPPLS